MKNIANLTIAILASLIAGIILGMFDPLIKSVWNNDRLVATIFPAPWQPLLEVDEKTLEENKDKIGYGFERLYGPQDWRYDAYAKYNYSYIVLHNKGKKTINDPKIEFANTVDKIILISPNRDRASHYRAKEIKLPNFAPGDRRAMTVFDSVSVPGMPFFEMKTFSSEGSFRIEKIKPTRSFGIVFQNDGIIFARYTLGGIVMLLVFVFVISEYYSSKYIKRILGDFDFYTSEHERYVAAPRKFEPKFFDSKNS